MTVWRRPFKILGCENSSATGVPYQASVWVYSYLNKHSKSYESLNSSSVLVAKFSLRMRLSHIWTSWETIRIYRRRLVLCDFTSNVVTLTMLRLKAFKTFVRCSALPGSSRSGIKASLLRWRKRAWLVTLFHISKVPYSDAAFKRSRLTLSKAWRRRS